MTGARILVVDDEPQILRFLNPALEASGYATLNAETGREALHLAATAAPDLDGKQALEKARAFYKGPIIILPAVTTGWAPSACNRWRRAARMRASSSPTPNGFST